MTIKNYLIDTFRYNDWANRQLISAIKLLPDKEEAMKLFSHLISAQNKWMNRVNLMEDDNAFHWFGPALNETEIEDAWEKSVNAWILLLESTDPNDLEKDVVFNRATDGKKIAVSLKDLALQLNYHSIHHRAQINSMISRQGITVPKTDYIFTKLRET